MEQQNTRVADDREARRFELFLEDELAGFIDYKPTNAGLSFLHTEIDPRFGGRGLGSVLVGGALDAVRSEGLSVLPFCPFVRRYIQDHPEYLELVPADRRARFELPAETPEAPEPTA
ncbi:GNAT family N-acetyltransferase [Actinocorallia aurantiaca]|jgi:predicted GNAT family acetyltransferase|uniref:N-acetyltransferase domain-containing protein n=1 Tax=Actinocorallia aurantiaca TaxID=46204 RepID=A0ABP6GSI4_9ACTN